MSVETKKLSLIKQILNTEDEAILDQIRQLLSVEKVEAVESNMLSEEEKQAIEEGLSDIKKGNVSSHEDVMRRVKEKFGL